MVKAKENEGRGQMGKAAAVKNDPLQQKILGRCSSLRQKYFRPEQAERMQALRKRPRLRKGRLYLNDEEFDCT